MWWWTSRAQCRNLPLSREPEPGARAVTLLLPPWRSLCRRLNHHHPVRSHAHRLRRGWKSSILARGDSTRVDTVRTWAAREPNSSKPRPTKLVHCVTAAQLPTLVTLARGDLTSSSRPVRLVDAVTRTVGWGMPHSKLFLGGLAYETTSGAHRKTPSLLYRTTVRGQRCGKKHGPFS
jgi:hypothetical protein